MPGLSIESQPPIHDCFAPGEISALRPSEYTALLIQSLRARPELVVGRDVLEIGTGRAAVLAATAATTVCHHRAGVWLWLWHWGIWLWLWLWLSVWL